MALPARLAWGALLLLACSSCAWASIRGANPASRKQYQLSLDTGHFKCSDGSATIPASRVNDNYCDCLDGSDEPGTSACPNGKFYCRNRGHEPRVLNASAVDDGICDCCDGSDEPAGRCPNTCREAGAAARQALSAAAKQQEQGLKSRDGYVKKAEQQKAAWQAEVDKLEAELAAAQAAADSAREEADKAREAESAEKARLESLKPPPPPPPPPAADPATPLEDGDASPSAPGREELPVTAVKEGESDEERAQHVAEQLAHDPEGTGLWHPEDSAQEPQAGSAGGATDAAAAGAQEVEETAEERGRRIAAQWTNDPAAAGVSGEEEADVDEEGDEEYASGEESEEELEVSMSSTEAEPVAAQEPVGVLGRVTGWLRNKFGGAGVTQEDAPPTALQELSAAAAAKAEAQRVAAAELARVQARRAELQADLAQDFGPDHAFLPLHGKCFDALVDKYTYQVCPYKSAEQKEGASSTSLGQWGGFEDNYTSMVFTGGQTCWQGPPRSLRVAVRCGATESVSKVEEPSRCTYSAELLTPAACSAAEVQQLQQRVQAAERELAESHDEL